ncbi:MAG: PRC-barrel domain-containing protein [Candidatus Marsarchaeota archaeon]|nr:PRC-barrel domain-containing protein [Candidatus Marsarchaeota archaeon]MCL5101971.1 PRC-barrel domain-containing protein [Candidatus Marsarchaeota archaeon]
MVKFIIGRQLVGKKVVTNDGFDVGRFVDADISPVTGKINAFIVEPNMDSNIANKLKIDSGQLKVPYNAVQAVNDYIIIDRKSM